MKRNLGTILLLAGIALLLALAGVAYNALRDRAVPTSIDAESSLEPATDFQMTDREGKEVALSDFAGKPVIVNFWATWCGPCKEELPYFEAAYSEYGEQIQFLMVDLTDGYSETPENAVSFAEEHGYHFPIYFDTASEGSYAYGVSAIPFTLAITADGRIAASHVGAMSQTELQALVELLLNQG